MSKKLITMAQIRWAKEHDWFHSADYNYRENRSVVRVIDWVQNGTQFYKKVRSFTDYGELREWAGY